MFLIRVIVLAKLPVHAPSVLDYFWSDSLVRGSLVRAALGRRILPAVVVDVLDFRTAKLAVKKSAFSLKKLTSVIADTPQLTPAQLELARWISVQYACSPATSLKTVAPPFIGRRGMLLDHGVVAAPKHPTPVASTVLLTQPDSALKFLSDSIRVSGGQTLVLVPDRQLIRILSSKLPAGVTCVHGGLASAELKTIYKGVLDGTIRNVVGTRSALFLPWSTLTHVIVEDPLNEMYKNDMTPRLNAPDVARYLAALHGANLTWLTSALSTVQYHLAGTGALNVEHRKPYWPAVTLTTAETQQVRGQRSLFSQAARDALLDAYEQRTPLLIFSGRRGYATVARCLRCRAPVICGTCDIPMRWHRTSEDMLVCYHCGAYIAVPRQCASCHAGTLKPSGIPGSQKLTEAVNAVLDAHGYTKLNIPILDSDLVRSPADVERTLAQLDTMEHPILVATAMIHSQRYDRTFATIIVPHMDMLTTNPDYRTQDRMILQLEKLADFMPARMILQTFDDEGLVAVIPSRAWDEFFSRELVHRKHLRWPPYTRIVKLSFSHRDRGVASRGAAAGADRIVRAIAHTGATGTQLLGPAPALVEKSGGRWTHHIIIKSTSAPSRLSALLQYVPEGWTIDVDPRSIS